MTERSVVFHRPVLTLAAVIREALASIVREMRRSMVRSSYSSIIYEGYDFSCVLTDGAGNLVAESGEDHPFHIIPIAGAVRGMTDLHGVLAEGEIVLHNDPYTGGTHLNDVAVIWPVFENGEPVFYVVIRSHWGDIGGMSPGSLNGAASEILQEGLRLNYLKLPKSGDSELLRLIFDNVRATTEAEADFRAVLGICRVAEERLRGLVAKYGMKRLSAGVIEVLDSSEARIGSAIAALPDGTWRHAGYMDGAAATHHPLKVQVALTVAGSEIIADFSGTDAQVMAPLNAGPAIAPTSVMTVVKSFLDPKGPINSGSLRAIKVHAPEGTLVNARRPAPCGGLNEVRFACDAAVMGALGQIVPERMTGDVRGTSNHTYIGTSDFIFYEYPSGGTGGSAGGDGAVAVRAFNEGENVSIQSAEIVEATFPLRIRATRIRTDSGGRGARRGGVGLTREIEVLTEGARLSVLSDRNLLAPAGVNGGGSGKPNRYMVRRDAKLIPPSPFPGKIANFPLQPGDVLVMESSGGGGFGLPNERPDEALADDLADGYITTGEAVAWSDRGPPPVLIGDDTLVPPHARISSALAREIGIELTGLLEIICGAGPALRLWVAAIDSALDGRSLAVPADYASLPVLAVTCLAPTTPFRVAR